jgi:hypothetical protein
MTTETITEQGHRHGTEYADDKWQLDPADYDLAVEWCRSADAGTLATDYDLPDDAADAIPADLDTAGWSWGELADYQGAWEAAYYARTTELCRAVIEQVNA